MSTSSEIIRFSHKNGVVSIMADQYSLATALEIGLNENCSEKIKIVDIEDFIEEFLHELQYDEDESGLTPLQKVFDAAATRVLENGSLSVNIGDEHVSS